MLNDALNDEADKVDEIAVTLPSLPFGFAKRHGVLSTAQNAQQFTLTCRNTVTATPLANRRRHFRTAIILAVLKHLAFATLLPPY